MAGLWRNRPATPEGKYLVIRRDGSIPDWPYFVLGANDPAAAAALAAYAKEAAKLGMDPAYVNDVVEMAAEWQGSVHSGHPDDPPEATLVDDPEIIAMMRRSNSA